jgi:DNA modification methylase
MFKNRYNPQKALNVKILFKPVKKLAFPILQFDKRNGVYMILKNIKLQELKHAEYNPRVKLQGNDPEYIKIKRSIEKFGYIDPIIVNSDYTIIGGHQRANVLVSMGHESIDCIVIDIDKVREKALNVALNKITGRWDFELLNELFKEIENDIDLSFTGFDDDELSKLFDKFDCDNVDENFDIDKETENIINPKTSYGDLYKIGDHRIICGDSTDENIIKKLMGEMKADLILTDPPYNVGYDGSKKIVDGKRKFKREIISNDSMSGNEFYEFLFDLFSAYFANSKFGAASYIFHADIEVVNFMTAFKNAGFKASQRLVWNKDRLQLCRTDYHYIHEPIIYGWKEGASHNWYSDRTQTSVLNFGIVKKSKEHPTMKPINMLEYLIKNSSKQGDLIIDFCGGSGSTLIAAENTKRICYTCELEPKYVDVIIKRIENTTGLTAVKIGDINELQT